MKHYFTLLFLSALLFIASSCKKIDNDVLTTPVELDTLASNGFKFDYVSIQIDGKTYVCKDDGGSYSWGNMQVNRKLESLGINGINLNNGDSDSVLFSREYTLSNDSTLYMEVLFCEKLAKKDCRQELWFYYPKDQLDLFRTGLQAFATDFKRENSYDGIGILLRLKEGDKHVTYSTYSLQYPNLPTSITNDSQKGSYFDIVKVASTKRGDYIEAKFKTKAFNLNEDVINIDKGFLRLQIGYFTKQ